MDYDFIIIDTKLMAFFGFHRRKPILNVVELILALFNIMCKDNTTLLIINVIENKGVKYQLHNI